MQMGDKLLAKGILTSDQLAQALAEQAKTKERLGDVIVKLGFSTKEKIDAALA
ncbi:MAG: hypothetical protein SFU91_15150 [Chloroherpetonaceae bacterium]|nr:hypothetical protein [Chloroherpetonaceae bacterium]